MNLTSPSQVREWCLANCFRPNRTMGQNFLVDLNVLKAIVDAGLAPCAGKESPAVLEIGPGLGVMTEELLARGCRVTAVEKDPALAARLAAALGNPSGLSVVEGDALDVIAGRGAFAAFDPAAFDCMVSNLPYQAGTRILLELVERRAPAAMTALMQTEVADRLAAKEGSRARGLAGVLAQLDYDVEVVRKVSASCFWPRPEVGSAVVRLVRHDRAAAMSPEERRMFRRIVKRGFEHRRKQLGGVFRGLLESTARAEELSVEDWKGLAAAFVRGGAEI